jgi:hypothetical protein
MLCTATWAQRPGRHLSTNRASAAVATPRPQCSSDPVSSRCCRSAASSMLPATCHPPRSYAPRGVVGADLRPVRRELVLVASGERRHLGRLRSTWWSKNTSRSWSRRPETHLVRHVADSVISRHPASVCVDHRGAQRRRDRPPLAHHLDRQCPPTNKVVVRILQCTHWSPSVARRRFIRSSDDSPVGAPMSAWCV